MPQTTAQKKAAADKKAATRARNIAARNAANANGEGGENDRDSPEQDADERPAQRRRHNPVAAQDQLAENQCLEAEQTRAIARERADIETNRLQRLADLEVERAQVEIENLRNGIQHAAPNAADAAPIQDDQACNESVAAGTSKRLGKLNKIKAEPGIQLTSAGPSRPTQQNNQTKKTKGRRRGRGNGRRGLSDREMQEREDNGGLSSMDLNMMLSYGIKPWDDNAYDILNNIGT